MIPQESQTEEETTQERNSMFQRLNKLANTKLLKDFISGQQLLDLRSTETEKKRLLKNKKIVRVLENRAQKAVEVLQKRRIKKHDEDGQFLERSAQLAVDTFRKTKRHDDEGLIERSAQLPVNKLSSEMELRPKPTLKSLGSLQLNIESHHFTSSHKKSSNAILQKIDSFEIEGPSHFENEKTQDQIDLPRIIVPNEPKVVVIETPQKNQEPTSTNSKIPSFQTMEIEELYDIRKTGDPEVLVENITLEELQAETAQNPRKPSKPRTLRKGFSYSDFETGEDGGKRKITFDKRFEQSLKNFTFCQKLKGKLWGLFNFSKMKIDFENSFVEVVITSDRNREIDVVLQRKKTIILPGSFVKRLTDVCLLILCLYVLFSTPIYIAFFTVDEYPNILGFTFECLFCFFFLIDIWVTLRTGYVNYRGVLELYPTKIIILYLKTNFFWDLVSTIPIIALFPDNPYLKLIYLLRLLKIIRLYQILNRLLEFSNIHPGFVRIIKCFIIWIILCHNIACFYWYISTQSGFTSDGWVPPDDISNMGSFHQYMYSLFFAITVTIGVGINISPVTIYEIVYSFFSIIIGVFMYGLLLGSATSALMGMDEEDSDMRKQMDSLNTFMRKKKVTLELQKRIQENLKYLWSSNQSLNITNQWFLKGVHPLLKLELMLQINKRYLEKVPLFKNLNFEGMINLISLLETRIYLPDEFVVYENQITEEMYFIQSGMLEVFDTNRSIKIRLFEGDFFGEQAIINRNSKRKASVKSIVYSELLILSRKGLEIIVLENQSFGKRLFTYLKQKILNKFKHMKTSKWDLVYMIKRAAINIKRMNSNITLESLFFPRFSRYNPHQNSIIRTNGKELDRIEESHDVPYELEDGTSERKPKTAKNRQFQENNYKTTSQLSQLVRNAMKEKTGHNRHRSAQPEELNEVIGEIERRKLGTINTTDKKEDSPYENYHYTKSDTFEEKASKFAKAKTLDPKKGEEKSYSTFKGEDKGSNTAEMKSVKKN